MTLVLSTSIPLITPFGCLFFFYKYYVDKYNLLFVYPVEFESHGNIGNFVIKFLLFGIFVFQFIISGLFEFLFPVDYVFTVTVIYLALTVFIYYLGRNYLFHKVDRNFARQSFFEFFKNNSRNIITQFFVSERPQISRISNVVSNATFEKFMKDAYVHPAEKDNINNPLMIWYDSYSFIRDNGRIRSKDPNDFVEYDTIIKKEKFK